MGKENDNLTTKGSRTLSSRDIEGTLYLGKDIRGMSSKVVVYCSDGGKYDVTHGKGANSGYLYKLTEFFKARPWLKVGDLLNYVVLDNCTIEIELPFKKATKKCELYPENEAQLRDFLAKNITALGNDLELFDGNHGVEHIAGDVGKIDLLCVDKSGNFVVVELKKDMPSDKVVGQISRYMGWVKKKYAHGKEVRGIIVVHQSETENIKLNYAVSANPSIQLRYYKISLEIL